MEMIRTREEEEEETEIGIHHLKKRKISDDLHDNILVQILQRVDADTLYSLRMVSKQWHNMILDPCFAISNLSYAGPPGCLLQCPLFGSSYKLGFLDLRGGEVVLRDLEIDLPKPIMASCNGVVLFGNYPKRGDYSIGNILSRKGKILPLQHYNNSWLENVLGFTYLKETNEYKIVCLMRKMCESYCVMIFTLGSNTWTEVKEPEPELEPKLEFAGYCEAYACFDFNEESILDFYPAAPVCVNNFLHSLICTYREVLVTIDTNNGTFHRSEIPFEYESGELVNLGGVLALHSKQPWHKLIKIWILKDFYRKEWTQLYCFQDEVIPGPVLEPFLIGNLGNGKVLLYSDSTKAFCYALDPQSGKVMKTLRLYLAHRRFCVQHVSSLVSSKSL